MADIQSNINVNVDTSGAISAIRNLQRQISATQQELSKGSATQVAEAAKQQQNLINNLNGTRKFSAEIQTIKTTTESFTTSLEKNKLSLGQYFRYSVAATKSFGGTFKTEMNVIDKVARERVKSLQTQYIKLGRDANGAMKAIAVRPLMLDLDNLQTKTAIAAQKQQILNQLLKQGSTNLLNFGKNTQWAGRQLMVGFTIPLMMAGTAAAKAYMQIEQASVNIRRVYGDLGTSVQETNRMVESIKNLATEYTQYGIAVADTMAMAAKAAAMGKTGSDLLAQVNNASRLSALGAVDQNTALETTISLTNAFGLSAEELAGKVNFLNAVENQTVLSIEDMTTAIPKAAPVVKQLGGNMEDLAFFMTAMKEGGIDAAEGANALKSGLASMINPTRAASEFLAGFGINIKAIVQGNKGDLKKTVTDFATALDQIDPLNRARAIEMMFGKFQFARISTLLKNVTDQGSQATKAAGLASMSAIQLAALSRKELDKISSSPMYQFQKAVADLQKKLAPVGESFLKAVTPIVNFVSKVLEGFNGMSEEFKSFAVVGTAVVGGLAPVLLMVVGLVANGAANIIKLFTNIKSFFNRTTTASQNLGETTSYLTTEQIKAEAVAASLEQTHSRLVQLFTAEASSIEMMTAAYSRYMATAGVGVAGPKAKGYATGGIVSGPGTATSDSVPANLSNGEVVLSVATVKKNPALVGALLSGKKVNVAGYAQSGVAGSEITSKTFAGGAQLAHFGAAGPAMTGRELLANAEADGEQAVQMANNFLAKEAKMLGVTVEDLLDTTFKTFTNKVVLLSSEINNIFGQTGSEGAGVVSGAKIKEEVAFRGKEMHGPMVHTMQRLGASGDEVQKALDLLDQKTKAAFAQFGDDMEITGDIFDATMDQIYREVAQEQGGSAKAAVADMSRVRNAESKKTGTNGSGNDRVNLSPDAYKGKNAAYIESVQEVTGTSQTPIASKRKMTRDQKNAFEQIEKSDPALARRIASAKTKEAFELELENVATGKSTEATKKKTKAVEKSTKAVVEESVAVDKVVVAEKKKSAAIGADGDKEVSYSQSGLKTARPTSTRTPSPFMQDIKASVQNAAPRLRVAKQEFVDDMKGAFAQLKDLFRRGGKDIVDSTKAGLIQETPRLVVAGKQAGFDYVTALKGGNGSIAAVVTSGNQKIIASALQEYNSGGFRVAGAVSRGLDVGIAAEVASGTLALKGKRIADAISDGTYMAGAKSKSLPYNARGPLLPGQSRDRMTISDRVAQAKTAVSDRVAMAKTAVSEKYKSGQAKGAKFLDEKVLNKTAGSLAKIGGAATGAVFALSMIPGPIGGFMQSILPLISIISILPPIFSMLGISTTALTGSMVMAALPVVAALVALAGVVALVVILNNQANEAKQRELEQINNSTRAHANANKALAEFGKLAGVTPGKNRMEVAKTALAAGVDSKQASDVNLLMESEEFKDPKSAINSMIGNIKGMTDIAAKDFLATYANTLKGAGFDDKAIDAILTAIKMKAGKTNLKLDFASVDINSKKGRGQVTEGLQNTLGKVSGKDVKDVEAQKEGLKDKFYTLKKGGSITLNKADAEIARNQELLKKDPNDKYAKANLDNAISAKKEIKTAIATDSKQINKDTKVAQVNNDLKTGANAVADTLNSAIGQFGTKSMSKKNFDATMKSVQDGLAKSSAKSAVMAAALKKLGPEASKGGAAIGKLSGATLKNGKAFDTTKAQLDLFAIAAANPTIGAELISQLSVVGLTADEAAIKIAGAKKAALGSAAGVTNTDLKEEYGDTSGSGGTDPKQLLNDTKASVAANVLTMNLMKKAYNAEFISSITSADAATQKYYLTTLKNGTKVLNEHGKALLAAFNTKTLSDFLIAQKGLVSGAAAELAARKTLKAAGMDEETVKAAAARSDVQAALAAAKSITNKKKQAAAIKSVIDALKAEKTAADSLSTTLAQEKFQKTYDIGTKYLDVQAAQTNRDFDKNAQNIKNQEAILKANQEMQDLQTGAGKTTGLNQYNNGLSKLQFTETQINKKYEDRAKALEKISSINQRINDQQKGQLSLAQALASGDIAAAANAAQDMNAQNATAAAADQKKALDEAKQKELESQVVSVNGKLMTRKEIEDASAIIQQKILDIQIGQLEPAQTALDLATRTRDATLKNIADQKAKWDDWKLSIDAATTSLAQYNAAINAAGPQATAAANEVSGVKTTTTTVSSPTPRKVSLGGGTSRMIGLSTGGMVPNYFAAGGFAKGTDTVPAMLTPGEFVVKKYAVDNFGVDNLRAINSGASLGGSSVNSVGVSNTNYDGSVYNYNVSVNVRSDANPDQIANAVMNKIGEVNSRSIRGNRL